MTLRFKDRFLVPDASSIGGNYTHAVGGFSIVGLQAKAMAAAIELYKGPATADCTVIAAEGAPLDTHTWGVVARYVDSSDYYEARVNGSNVDLVKVVAGVKTVIGGPQAVTRAVGAALQFDLVGSKLQVWYNGVLLFTATDATYAAAGPVGFSNDGTWTTYLNRFDARWDTVLTAVPNSFKITPVEYSEIVEYDSGFVQRNLIWLRPKYIFAIGYDALRTDDGTYQYILNFRRSRRGQYQSFLLQDPRLPSVTGDVFAVADGVSTLYKVNHDKADSITTYTDGSADGAVTSLASGVVVYGTPPYAGAVLSYNATNAYYRCFMVEASLDYNARVPNFYTAAFGAVQEKSLLEGVPQ